MNVWIPISIASFIIAIIIVHENDHSFFLDSWLKLANEQVGKTEELLSQKYNADVELVRMEL